MESSSFLGAPIVYDANGDGIPEAVMVDYDGGIYFVGLKVDKDHKRFFHKAQIPRLYVRKSWVEARLNETLPQEEKETNETEVRYNTKDPFHSYFEYGSKETEDTILRGITANLMGQDTSDLKGLEERRQRKVDQTRPEEEIKVTETPNEEVTRRRLQEVDGEDHRTAQEEVHQDAGGELHYAEEVHHRAEEGEVHQNAEGELHFAEEVHHRAGEGEVHHGEGGLHSAKEVHHHAEADGITNSQDQRSGGEANETDDHHSHHKLEYDDIAHEDSEDAEWEAARGGEGNEWADDDQTPSRDESEEEASASEDQKEPKNETRDGEDKQTDDNHRSPYDDYTGYRHHGYDDYSGGRYGTPDDFYDTKHYIRLPPHVLSTPVLAEMKKAYSTDKDETEEMLFVAVSYYFDEDEYDGLFSYKRFEATDKGDETESSRGMYVASALVVYILDGSSPRFGREEHLDLSCDATAPQTTLVGQVPIRVDETKLGAFALGSPTIADIDGNGDEDVLMGTSMGMVYCFHARHLYNSDGWPVQVGHAVESRILVEDTMGDTNLEVYVNDVGGNIYCFTHKAQVLWRRQLLSSVTGGAELRGSSPMTMGDVDGDGKLDIVMTVKTLNPRGEWSTYIIAVSAVTGKDLAFFPIEFDSPLPLDDGMGDALLHMKLAQPLLVDLHADQSHWNSYLYRNGTAWQHPTKKKKGTEAPPHGGGAPGLHIVQPIGSNLYIVEAGSGCVQMVAIGEEVAAMVQVDDVHGTNNLDLVVSTTSGNIVTLESPVVPYHPLNVWNTGEVRSRRNNFVQGFTASQGIFVRDVSRRFRDVFGVYVPVTLEIFDNRPNIANEPDKRVYKVEIRDGTSPKRAVFRKTYSQSGVYTERLYINYGPGFYTLSVLMKSTHGIYYEDIFHVGYNVHFMDGFGLLLYLPLFLAAIPIFFCSKKKANWDDDDFGEDERDGKGLGILGRA